jgi:bilin biosynthesis protein
LDFNLNNFLKNPMTQDNLFAQLKHPNPHLRDRAMFEIAETRDSETISKLMSALDDEDVVYRRAAVKALGVIGQDAVPSIVDGMLHSENITVKGSCVKALTQVALNYPELPFPAEGLQGLKQSMQDPNPVVYIAAVMTLGEIGVEGLDILTEALAVTDNPALGVSIVNALASIGDERSAEVLTKVMNDEAADSYVKETAISALSRLELVAKYKRVE